MKTIKLLLIGILVVATSNIVAQEKQNDATWEETISFLKENISRFDQPTDAYYFDQNIIIRERIDSNNDPKSKRIYSAESKDLLSIDIEKTSIRLTFRKNSVKFKNLYNNKFQYEDETIISLCSVWNKDECKKRLYNSDDEFVKRIYKAFQHLAYLAKEKRKKSKF